MRGRAEAARRAHNPEVIGSNPIPATFSLSYRVNELPSSIIQGEEMAKFKRSVSRVRVDEKIVSIHDAYDFFCRADMRHAQKRQSGFITKSESRLKRVLLNRV